MCKRAVRHASQINGNEAMSDEEVEELCKAVGCRKIDPIVDLGFLDLNADTIQLPSF